MLIRLKSLHRGLQGVIFPHVCEVCGQKLSNSEHFVCSLCLNERFEIANPMGVQSSGGVILPEGVFAQHALWNFDKGGQLQDLLHHLKYNRLSGVGEDLGKALGQSFRRNRFLDVDQDSAVLVPVPLHPGKKRKRGYNQARYIAKGVEVATEIAVCDPEDVIRVKNTRTQTGFSLENRRKNIEGAFKVNKEDMFRGKVCIIVDDVFTTGATTFELASVLLRSGAVKILIATVAQA